MDVLESLRKKEVVNSIFVAGILLIIAAAYVAFWSLHPNVVIELVFIITGFSFILLRFWLVPYGSEEDKRLEAAIDSHKLTIASRFIKWLTLGNRLVRFFPFIAVLLLASMYAYNRFLSPRPELGNGDYILIAIAAVMMIYNMIPKKYSIERDFVFLFLILIFLFLIAPIAIYDQTVGDPDSVTTSPWVHYFVSVPASAMTSLFGVSSSAHFDPQIGSQIVYSLSNGGQSAVGIALGCSGLYSVIIFFCAYASFLLTNFTSLERRLIYAFVLGFALAWFANIIRIATTVAAGSWWGSETLFWFHENIGILIFLAWTALFWYLIFKYIASSESLRKREAKDAPDSSA